MIKQLTLPLDIKTTRSLEAGQLVTLAGMIFTGRESFYLRAVEENILPALDYDKINVMMHVGPVLENNGFEWKVLGLTPTTSIRMEKYAGPIIRRLKTRALIGKGTMGEKTTNAMKDTVAVHLSPIGIYPVLLARQVKKVENVFFLQEIGPTEATWVLTVENFGPFLVDIDSRGKNYFGPIILHARNNKKDIYRKYGIPLNYKYTPI